MLVKWGYTRDLISEPLHSNTYNVIYRLVLVRRRRRTSPRKDFPAAGFIQGLHPFSMFAGSCGEFVLVVVVVS